MEDAEFGAPALPSGRDAALTALFTAYHRQLVGLALLLVDDLATAEDVVQDAFLALHRRWFGIRDTQASYEYLRYEIRTGSMTPAMPAGDAVLDRPTHAVHTGDVVTYRGGPDGYTTHRVVAVTHAGIETKGDANRSRDWGYRSNADIAGHVVVRLPYGGYLLRFGHSHRAIAGLLLLIAGILTWPPRRSAAPAQREPIAAS